MITASHKTLNFSVGLILSCDEFAFEAVKPNICQSLMESVESVEFNVKQNSPNCDLEQMSAQGCPYKSIVRGIDSP